MSAADRPTLLLVDDEPNILSALGRALRSEPYRVLTTSDPGSVFSLIQKEKVDVIVCDIQMPAMTGLEVVASVRRAFPQVVRMLLTGNGSLESALQAINEGEVYRFLTKPWDADVLRETIREAMARSRELRRTAASSGIAERREKLLAELEREHPGITQVDRDGGIYRLDQVHLEGARARIRAEDLRALLGG